MAGSYKPVPMDADGQPIPKKYDPHDFIVAPADSRGISYRMTFRGPPDMEKAIDQVIASHLFPFSTRGDVLRWCVREGIRILDSLESVTSVTKRIDILTGILNEETAHAEFMHIFTHLQDSVDKYLADQAPEQAMRVLTLARHQFEGMPSGWWRTKYLGEMQKRFAHLMVGDGVALGNSSHE